MLFLRKYVKILLMKITGKVKNGLDKKFQKVLNTPASFDFFVAIHDFVEHIEANSALSGSLASRSKTSQQNNISIKYGHLKQIYQGLEDAHSKSGVDLGHARYMALAELNKIKETKVPEGNSFWRKREVFRKLTEEVYGRLSPDRVA